MAAVAEDAASQSSMVSGQSRSSVHSRSSQDDAPSDDEGEGKEVGPVEVYTSIITKLIQKVEISGAKVDIPVEAEITSSRTRDKGPRVSLPFSREHRRMIDSVWKTDPGKKVPMFKSNTKARYYIAEPDRVACLSAPSKPDGVLAQELWRNIPGSKFKIKKPRLPDKEPQKVDAALKKLEKQAAVALGTIVTQSWLLQYANTQLIKFCDLLVASSTAEQFKEMNEAVTLEECHSPGSGCSFGYPGPGGHASFLRKIYTSPLDGTMT
jgi:hypothetical protein